MPRSTDLGLVSRLCLGCGLCCNGVVFADVCLVDGDDPVALRAAGLAIESHRGARPESQRDRSERTVAGTEPGLLPWRFRQPCSALAGDNACGLYPNHPARCRAFECALFRRVRRNADFFPSARRRIAATQGRVDRVESLLHLLGEPNQRRALFTRVQSVRRRFERQPPDRERAARYADLTVAVHELRLALSRDFTGVG